MKDFMRCFCFECERVIAADTDDLRDDFGRPATVIACPVRDIWLSRTVRPVLYSGCLAFVCASCTVQGDRCREFKGLIVVQLMTRRTEEIGMGGAVVRDQGMLWWWVVLMMRGGAGRGTTSADNRSGQETASTLIPRVTSTLSWKSRRAAITALHEGAGTGS